MTFALYEKSTTETLVASTHIPTDQSSSTPAVPARAAGTPRAITLARDPIIHEDLWYALSLMRPCNPMGDYGFGLAILSGYGISEDDAREVMASC